MIKTDKSCIILIYLLDNNEGDVCMRYLDIPTVNIGTAPSIFRTLKESLS